ncbi:long-chain-fatty-acid--CoA ligase [Desulfotomaculum copahuensis]|uniref:long-chain-fatty-acid--CoA ligase n=1 Tax=Desulfotomaculum copahuensis TaxID=1838280 RepID=UPI000AACA482|nr:long-chain-fatty-acid--CoA ligase [Desulfotomaculum copahuensis]
MNKLAYMINRAGRYYAKQTAVVLGDRRLTFAEVDGRSNQLARALIQLGVAKGERVAILLYNCLEYIETDFALIKAGFVRLPLSPRLSPGEYSYMINNAEASTLVFGREFTGIIEQIKGELETVKHFVLVGEGDACFAHPYDGLLSAQSASSVCVDVCDDDPYQVLYTSGTTGWPKGAVTTFRSRLSTLATVLIEEMRVTRNDVMLSVAPLAHGGGTKILPHFVRGAVNVLLPKYSPESFCRTVEKERVTTTWLVPTMIIMLLEYPDLKKFDLSSLKTVVYAASPMPVATLRRALETFGNIFVQVYGLSEAPNPDLLLPKEDHILDGTEQQLRRLQSAGREVFGVRVRVVDAAGKDVPPGDIGEIIITGDNIMTGYWKMLEATAENIREGWLYTGDMATVDEDGYVYIVDRRKDMIISGGFNIYPREVEEVLHRHLAVVEAAVIGVPDELWGESVKAVVVCRPETKVSEDELIAFCQANLASYKKPKSIEFVKELPKSANGKILKRELKKKVLGRLRPHG